MAMDISTLAVLFPLLLLLLGLAFIVGIDPYIRREHRRTMLIIVALCLTLIVQNYWENELFISHSNLALKNFLSAYGYSVRPVILVLFLYIVFPKGKKWLQWTLVGVNAALYFSSPWTKLCFDMQEPSYFTLRGPLWVTCFLISGILLAELLVRTLAYYRKIRKLEQLIPLSVALVIIVSVALDLNVGPKQQPVAFLTIAIIVGSVFYYIWLHLQFVREHERDLMAAQRIQIMMTQIQPHFLFNALNTIRALYAKDSPQAERTLEDFSAYLRQNLESLSQTDLIPVSKELEHTRLYAEIETQRFPNVQVEYRIGDTQFAVPALTIQPLVENAIRHGVRSREDGLVIVSTALAAGGHRVTVADNGVGFDPQGDPSTDQLHLGIRNVKERVERMCGGELILTSEVGKGTSVTMLFPDGPQRGSKETKNESDLC